MDLGDTLLYLVRPNDRPRPCRVVKKWSEDLANVVVDLDGENDQDDFGARETTSCTAHRRSVRFFGDAKIPNDWTAPCLIPRPVRA